MIIIGNDATAVSKATSSWRHHFIPQFFIKGFKSPEEKYYVYDKLKDEIRRKDSSEQMFYVRDKNNVTENGVVDSYLEGSGHSRLDDIHAPAIRALRDEPCDGSLLTRNRLRMLLYFRAELFWSNPSTDKLYADFFSRGGTVHVKNEKGELLEEVDEITAEQYKSSEKAQKAHRITVVMATVAELDNASDHVVFHHHVYESPRTSFLLGDYPFIYINRPNTMLEVVTNQVFLPISPTRVYYNKAGNALKFDDGDRNALNALIINNSTRYVCSADKELLTSMVGFYKMVKARSAAENIDLFYHLRMRLFHLGY